MIKGLNERILEICRRLDNHHFLTQELQDRYRKDLAVLLEQRDKYVETTEANKKETVVPIQREETRISHRNPTSEQVRVPIIPLEFPREPATLDRHEIPSTKPPDYQWAQVEERDEGPSLPRHSESDKKK